MDLTKLILALAPLVPQKNILSSLIKMIEYDGLNGKYIVSGLKSDTISSGAPIAQTSNSKLYVAQLPSGQFGFMKIALETDYNDCIVRESSILRELQLIAREIDNDCQIKGLKKPNYGAFFPKVLETFDAGPKKAMFLGFDENIESYQQFSPLSSLTVDQRIDLQTGHWILGKLLKVLAFIHNCHYSFGLINSSNILLETNLHGVFLLDFSATTDDLNSATMSKEISAATKVNWFAAGGNNFIQPPHDSSIMSLEDHDIYLSFLSELIKGTDNNTDTVIDKLYQLSDNIWPKVPKENGAPGLKRQFHQFCTYPKIIKE